jgi:hypothetical protein
MKERERSAVASVQNSRYTRLPRFVWDFPLESAPWSIGLAYWPLMLGCSRCSLNRDEEGAFQGSKNNSCARFF